MKKLRAVIVDDDSFCCFHLQDMILHKTNGVEIIAICHTPETALEAIIAHSPDVVFLDVEMQDGMSGFDLLKKFQTIGFDIIFTTAYEHYAIRAIRFSAVDYLIKPINASALQEAVSRVKEKKKDEQFPSMLPPEIITPGYGKVKQEHLAIPTMEGLSFIELPEIIYCEASDKYTKLFLQDKKMILSSRTLGDYETLLLPCGFCRIHKSYLVNLKRIKKYLRGEGGQVIMADGTTLDVSRRKKEDLLKLVASFR